jgi:hypothetical protein
MNDEKINILFLQKIEFAENPSDQKFEVSSKLIYKLAKNCSLPTAPVLTF